MFGDAISASQREGKDQRFYQYYHAERKYSIFVYCKPGNHFLVLTLKNDGPINHHSLRLSKSKLSENNGGIWGEQTAKLQSRRSNRVSTLSLFKNTSCNNKNA
uniref:Galectin n=1 Tax=Romanomermis culicivorax TaxID=13658 RepID=A0A915J2V0_ROMCU